MFEFASARERMVLMDGLRLRPVGIESYIKLLHLDYTYGWRATRHSEVLQARYRINNAKKKLQ